MTFDPFDEAVRADPWPHLARLRETGPLHRAGAGWLAVSHEVVSSLLADPRVSHWRAAPAGGGAFADIIGRWLGLMHPRGRSRLRALTAPLFSPAAIAALAPPLRAHADELLERVDDSFDLVADYAEPLTFFAVARMLGIPRAMWDAFAAAADAVRGRLFNVLGGGGSAEDNDRAAGLFIEFMDRAFEAKEAERGADLMTAMLGAADDDGLTRDDFVALSLVFLFAGQENTMNFIASAARTLAAHPAELGRLRDDRSLLPRAIEELLRFESPVQYVHVVAAEDFEAGGVAVARGDWLLLSIAAANRDPAVFPHPDALDLGREPNPHVSLGHGPFFCVGASLARLEASVALDALLDHIHSLEVDEPGVRWRIAPRVLRGPETLPVRVHRAAMAGGTTR